MANACECLHVRGGHFGVAIFGQRLLILGAKGSLVQALESCPAHGALCCFCLQCHWQC
jgi:hypothetical protein